VLSKRNKRRTVGDSDDEEEAKAPPVRASARAPQFRRSNPARARQAGPRDLDEFGVVNSDEESEEEKPKPKPKGKASQVCVASRARAPVRDECVVRTSAQDDEEGGAEAAGDGEEDAGAGDKPKRKKRAPRADGEAPKPRGGRRPQCSARWVM
jgi:hypothetical protein